MRKHLISIQKAMDEHQEAFKEYCAKTTAMELMLGKSIDGLRGPATGDSFQQGHLGNIVKLANANHAAHGQLVKGYDALQGAIRKSVGAMAERAGVALQAANANDRSDQGAQTHDGHDLSNSEIEHGLKGAKASDLAKMSRNLPHSTPLATNLGHVMQKALGRHNPNEVNPHFGRDTGTLVKNFPLTGQTRVMSEYEKRHQRG